jgi:hypothetical protein
LTFKEIFDYCVACDDKNQRALFKCVITTSIGVFDHLLCKRNYVWQSLAAEQWKGGHTYAVIEREAAPNDILRLPNKTSRLSSIQCDFVAYTKRLGHQKYFDLNTGDFPLEDRRSCSVSIADPSMIPLYIANTITELGEHILKGE